jgi:D-serine deaminase-like pyridoxal phosphate-dependent protein
MNNNQEPWYAITNAQEVPSPALLVYPDRIEYNIRKMIEIASGAERLRPHVKTHKMAEIIMLQMKYGIRKFKCATISEAEMVASCGAQDILMAYQPVGPNIDRFFNLKKAFPSTTFSCLADDEDIIRQISGKAAETGLDASLWLDLNVGMNRTGIIPGKEAARLYGLINELPGLRAEGLHVYDGHIHDIDFAERKKISDQGYSKAVALLNELKRLGHENVKVIAGGTPTFPVHALRKNVDLSPGTTLLWDHSYSSSYKDMDFQHAAVLLMRVISKPDQGIFTLDLGHKAVAAEMPQPRIKILTMEDYTLISQSEEHLVVKSRTPP